VAYIAAQGAEALEYELEISYRFGEEHLSLQTERASIGITAEKPPEIPENLYDTRTVMGFRVDENGEVFSPEFYGRNHEKDRVADLFRDNVFFEYKNALIRGIKRSGKSSLLHYIKTYAQVHCPDALVIIVDCQAVTTNIMHTVFVQKVLEEIASTYPEVKKELAADLSDLGSATGWDAFAAGWNAKQTDFESGELQSFYLALKEQLGGKGLILILDEVDKAFSELHPSDFNTLRALLGSEGYAWYEAAEQSELAFYECEFGETETSYFMFHEEVYTEDCRWSDTYLYPDVEYPDVEPEGPIFDPDTMQWVSVLPEELAGSSWEGYAAVNPESGETVALPFEDEDGFRLAVALELWPDGIGQMDDGSQRDLITWGGTQDGSLWLGPAIGGTYSMTPYVMGGEDRIWLLLDMGEIMVWLY